MISKFEPITVYEVSSQNSDWFIAEYNNIQGYIYADLVTKEKLISKNEDNKKSNEWITKKDDEEEENDITDTENLIENIIENCNDEYSAKNSLNSKNTHNQYCSCFANGVIDIITEEDLEYYKENEKYSDKYINKENKLMNNCAEDTGFKFELSDEEWITEQIQKCKNTYEIGDTLSKSQHNEWCKCYHSQWLDLVTDEDSKYFEEYGEVSTDFQNKEDELGLMCFKEIE